MSALSSLVGVRPGEGERVALVVAVGFVAAAGLMIGGSAIEAIYFAGNGVDGLPVLYLLLGLSMAVASVGFTALLGAVGRGRACLAVPLALAALAGAGRLALLGGGPAVAPALWLLQAIAQFLVNLAVWGLAGIVTDTRQAKRFFPLIGAGVVLGYVLGGLATKPLAAALGTENLLLVWIVSLVVVVVVGARIVTIGDGWAHRRSGRDPGPLRALQRGVAYVRRSPVMRWMALGSLLFSLLFFSLYLPFSGAAAQRYPDPDQLAGFFGMFFGLSTGLAFVLSLVVTNRLLARFGVPAVLLVLPILYVVSFGALTARDSFAALLVARFVQVAWLQGGAVSALEAVTNTVPAERRDQARAFLYGGPTQLGTVAAGVIALAQDALSATTRFGIALAAAVLATVAMLGVRRQYPRELVRALREGRPSVFAAVPDPADPFALSREDRAAAEAAIAALEDPDPRLRRIGATVVADLETPDRTARLVRALNDADADVRAIAIDSLARTGATEALDAVTRRVADPEPRVRIAAVRAVGALAPDRASLGDVLDAATRDPDEQVRAEAAGVLVRDGTETPDQAALLLSLSGADRASVRAAAFRGLLAVGDDTVVDAAFDGLADPDPQVRAEAARALPSSTAVTERLIGALREPERRDGVLAALATRPAEPRRAPTRAAAMTMVRDALERRAQSLAIGTDDDARARLLRDSLAALADREARAAVRTVASLDAGAALSVALDNLSVTDDARRANALEVLDGVGDREVVRPLLALWEGEQERPRPRGSVVDALVDDPDEWIRTCARFARDGQDRSETGGTMGEAATTLSPMERVLFLREVSLFASLPPADLLPIAAIAEERSFLAGDRLAYRGESGDEMYIVVSGAVSVSIDDGGSPARIATRHEGDVIGEMALLTGHPRVADLTAAEDVRTLAIARPQFESILRERPETALAVITVLCERLEEFQGEPSYASTGTP